MQSLSPCSGTQRESEVGKGHGHARHEDGKHGDKVRGPNANVSGSRSSALAVVSSETLNLTIVTAEGDRVTLRSESGTTQAYATYSATTNQGSTQARAELSSSNSSLSLQVEGNLSRAELKDVAKALQAYTQVLRDILSGNMEPAQAHAAQISNLDEIASFDASFTSQQAISAQAQSASFGAS
jgi:hypothetical protein